MSAAKPTSILGRVLREYAWQHRLSYAAGAAFLLLTNYLGVRIPVEIGASVDALKEGRSLGTHALIIALMGATIIVVRALSRVLFFNPGRDIEYKIRRDLFGHLLDVQPSFYAGQKTGDIVSRASNDITVARAFIGFGGLQVVNTLVAVALTGAKMLQMSVSLTLFALVPIGLGLAAMQLAIGQMFSLQRRNQVELGQLSDQVLGTFQGMATIQSFVAEKAFEDRFQARNDSWYQTALRLSVVRSLFMPLLTLSAGLGVFAILYAGGPRAVQGGMSVGELVTFTALVSGLVPPLRGLGFLLSVVQRGLAALDRIFELIDTPVERPEGPQGRLLPRGKSPGIRTRGLSFAYPDAPDHAVLTNVNVDIPPGSVVGLFGRTGSGRSTLLKVLARMYNPPPGTVSIDGVDIRELDLHAWRKQLAVVPQRPFLFSDSIAKNVALDGTMRPERVDDAVRRAALEPDLAMLPEGLGTIVGERGILLSGGQRQRVALARGLYREPDLVLLDDVLSAVDHETEQKLVDSLREVGDRPHPPTTLIASHRISALRHADQILVFEDGRIVDQGTHAELCRRPGLYYDSWLLQQDQPAPELA